MSEEIVGDRCQTCGEYGGQVVGFSYGAVLSQSRWVCPHCLDRMATALHEIAAFDDEGGNDWLTRKGSYGHFDEPNAVFVARMALKPLSNNQEDSTTNSYAEAVASVTLEQREDIEDIYAKHLGIKKDS